MRKLKFYSLVPQILSLALPLQIPNTHAASRSCQTLPLQVVRSGFINVKCGGVEGKVKDQIKPKSIEIKINSVATVFSLSATTLKSCKIMSPSLSLLEYRQVSVGSQGANAGSPELFDKVKAEILKNCPDEETAQALGSIKFGTPSSAYPKTILWYGDAFEINSATKIYSLEENPLDTESEPVKNDDARPDASEAK